MNVVLPEKPKILNRRNVTYLTIFIVCTVAIAIAVYQFFSEEKLGVIIGITNVENEQILELKEEFNDLFKNELLISNKTNVEDVKKISNDEDFVYTNYSKQEKTVDNYEISANIPYINIDNNITKDFNEEIKNGFEKPAEYILGTNDRNIVYNVNYFAFIENDILSVTILSTFKEGNEVQRTIVKTYNYNIRTKSEVTLDDLIKLKEMDQSTVQTAIKEEIQDAQEQSDNLGELGYNIFTRDISDDMYKIENASNYFLYDGYLYIIYAYGNTNNTSEIDIVII